MNEAEAYARYHATQVNEITFARHEVGNLEDGQWENLPQHHRDILTEAMRRTIEQHRALMFSAVCAKLDAAIDKALDKG